MRYYARITLSIATALLLVACSSSAGSADDPVTSGSDEPGGSPAPVAPVSADGILQISDGTATGPGISIEEAIAQAGSQPLLVNGALVIDPDGTVLLCSALAESYPPQCGGTRLLVRGLAVDAQPDLQQASGVRWAEQVQLLGTVSLVEG